MKVRNLFIQVFVFTCVSYVNSQNRSDAKQYLFQENKGQVHDQFSNPRPDVLFSGTNGHFNFHLMKSGISYQLSKSLFRSPETQFKFTPHKTVSSDDLESVSLFRLDIKWLNGNDNIKVIRGSEHRDYENFYCESSPNGSLKTKKVEEIVYANLYDGIDLRWYEKEGELKYEYRVAAGVDYKIIKISVEGATKISVNFKGELIISTPIGDLVEAAPIVLQKDKVLPSRWKVLDNLVFFEIEDIDSSQPLLIDPLVRYWGSYFGGPSEDNIYYSCTDKWGNVFVAGETKSLINIATVGAHEQNFQGTYMNFGDAFLAKFNAAGVRQWCTYYGGASAEYASACAADSSGNVLLYGSTSCTNSAVIATPGAYQVNFAGGTIPNGPGDAFLVKFDSTGQRLWGTYFGGSNWDCSTWGCTVDKFGDIYICGATTSTSNIAGGSGYNQTISGNQNGFLVKFTSLGLFVWGTYYGGVGGWETAYSCKTDVTGNVYLSGYTRSATGISTPNSHQPIYGGGANSGDAYIAKFAPNGSLIWGTYYGGTGDEDPGHIFLDSNCNLYLPGFTTTQGTGIIATNASHQSSFGGGTYDGFLVKFDSSGVRQWGTYYGDYLNDGCTAGACDPVGNIYIVGYTNSNGSNLVTPCTYQSTFGGIQDVIIAKFDTQGNRIWGTYYGGNQNDIANHCSADAVGNLIVVGNTNTTASGVIASQGAYQTAHGGGPMDGFLVKFDGCIPGTPVSNIPDASKVVCFGKSAVLTSTIGCSVNWYTNANITTPFNTTSSFTTVALTRDTTFYAEQFSCNAWSPRTAIAITVVPQPSIEVSPSSTVICFTQSATLQAIGAVTYSWSNGLISNPVVIYPHQSQVYFVIGTNQFGCTDSAFVFLNVTNCLGEKEFKEKESVKIFPNPFSDEIEIRADLDSEMDYVVRNSIGAIVKAYKCFGSVHVLNLSDLSAGVYFLTISPKSKESGTYKIVKH